MGYPMNRSFAYQETSITTASPEKLIIMLYEGAIRFLRQSANDIKTKNLVRKSQSIDRAVAVIQHLQSTLDMDGGKDIARELDRLYGYILSRVLQGSAKLDAATIEEATKLLSVLLSGWEQIARNREETRQVPSALLAEYAGTQRIELHA